jgi:hypothetical protein
VELERIARLRFDVDADNLESRPSVSNACPAGLAKEVE